MESKNRTRRKRKRRRLNDHLHTSFGVQAERVMPLPNFVHTFTHFRLTIHPLVVWVGKPGVTHAGTMWLDRHDARGAALPTPAKRLLDLLD